MRIMQLLENFEGQIIKDTDIGQTVTLIDLTVFLPITKGETSKKEVHFF